MLDEHVLGRAAIYPKFNSSETQAFDEEQLFEFGQLKEADGSGSGVYALSIASEILARGQLGVHGYGKRSASRQNDGFRARKGRDPDPESVYLGYFRFNASVVTQVKFLYHEQRVRWYPEHDEICHFQIEVHPIGGGTKRERRNDRRLMVRTLSENYQHFVKMDDGEYDVDSKKWLDDLMRQISST